MATKSPRTPNPTPPLNPFFIALNGITSLFSHALSVGIIMLLFGAASSSASYVMSGGEADSQQSFERTVHHIAMLEPAQLALMIGIVGIIILFVFVVSAMLHGIQSYTAARLARGEKITIGEAFNTVLGQFGTYMLLYAWMNIKIFLWTLLLIIPGIIAYYRYSFAGIVFFDKSLRGEAAVKESTRLTKGGLMTLFSSHLLFNLLTFGYIDRVVSLASTSELYCEYTALDAADRDKPPIHWLSWVTLALPFVIIAAILEFIIVMAVVIGLTGGLLGR